MYPYSGLLSGPKEKEVLILATAWVNTNPIMLCGRSQSHKDTLCRSYLYEVPEIGKSLGTERKSGFPGDGGKWEMGGYYLMGSEFLFGIVEPVLEWDAGCRTP